MSGALGYANCRNPQSVVSEAWFLCSCEEQVAGDPFKRHEHWVSIASHVLRNCKSFTWSPIIVQKITGESVRTSRRLLKENPFNPRNRETDLGLWEINKTSSRSDKSNGSGV